MKHDPVGQGPSRFKYVLVIDDHPLYCDALASSLRHAFQDCQIKTASTLSDGLGVLRSEFAPDMVMLDLRLPDVAGLSGFLQLRDKLPDTPILVISAFTSSDVIEAVMEAGAVGFVPKDVSAHILQSAFTELQAGRKFLPPGYQSPARPAPYAVDVKNISEKIAALTPQQTRIMKLICAGKPNKQIAYELSLAEATVKAHITALLRRLGVQNRTQAAVLVESVSLDSVLETSTPDIAETGGRSDA